MKDYRSTFPKFHKIKEKYWGKKNIYIAAKRKYQLMQIALLEK